MASLEDLKIYKMACDLEKFVYELVISFPKEEKYRQIDQMKRSSASVCDNIAEGYGKFSFQSKIQSFYVARGEAMEIKNQLERSINKKFVTKNKAENLIKGYTELIKGINGYINYLRKEKENLVS
ncbi:MAG: four helix bundle protein [Patescibacteria group bacterium]|nr:four helix bundle protein [Patescibacteria group bacterium]